MTGDDIANAFAQHTEKTYWSARAAIRETGDVVHFTSTTGMVALEYHCDVGRFAVKFTKVQAAWGDYVKAIARSLHTVLNALKSGGLPFDAPTSLNDMRIEATTADDIVYVSWVPAVSPIMPEQALAWMRNAPNEDCPDCVKELAETNSLCELHHGIGAAIMQLDASPEYAATLAELRGMDEDDRRRYLMGEWHGDTLPPII